MIEGIDVSSNNRNYQSLPTAGLQLCIVKLTQGAGYTWDGAPAAIAWARTWAKWVMGYHWIDPTISATAQANHFNDTYSHLELDGWWLDIEDPRHPVVPWVTLVPSVFDLVAARHDAHRGGCYKGRYFAPELNGYCAAHNWWDPDYRGGADTSGGVLMHQYTSAGGPGGSPLDRNRVLDEARFLAMVGSHSAPPVIVPPVSEASVFLCQEKGSATVHAIGAGPNGVTDITAANLPAWEAALVIASGRKEAASIVPVEAGFVANVRNGS